MSPESSEFHLSNDRLKYLTTAGSGQNSDLIYPEEPGSSVPFVPAAKSPEVELSGPYGTVERFTGYQNSSPSDDQ